MWNSKQPQRDVPALSPVPGPASPITPLDVTPPMRSTSPAARTTAWLGPSLEVKGQICGDEDLQIDGRVEGPITLQGNKLTVGRAAQLNSAVVAREVVIYGKVSGNLRARDLVEIKRDGSVIGDITTARVMIEDGAYFKGRIEIDRAKPAIAADLESASAPAVSEAS